MLAVLIYKLVLKNLNSANFTIYSNDVVSSKVYFILKPKAKC